MSLRLGCPDLTRSSSDPISSNQVTRFKGVPLLKAFFHSLHILLKSEFMQWNSRRFLVHEKQLHQKGLGLSHSASLFTKLKCNEELDRYQEYQYL
ncbi:hypothetical protein TNCV_2013501 [Trichonephila clavipes]|nr:hypothetical protein TNCV_2013501 [Trichonephila clavipes]